MCFHRGKVPHFPIFSYLFPVRGKLVPLHLWKLTCCAGVWNFPISCIREICAYGFLCWKQIIVRKVISILLMDPWQTHNTLHLGNFSAELCLGISLIIDWPWLPSSFYTYIYLSDPSDSIPTINSEYQMDATHAPSFFPSSCRCPECKGVARRNNSGQWKN